MDEDSYDQDNNFVVEAIVDKRMVDGEIQYLLKWKNFPPEENTWEPSTNLNCPALLDDFERNHPNGSAHRSEIPSLTTHPTNKSERKIKKSKRDTLPENLELDEIIGASDASGELMFLIKWKNSKTLDMVPASTINVRYPQQVIKFYEERIVWSK